jgi:hypothetical protein
MLATALEQHSQLSVAGEVFWRPETYGVARAATVGEMLADVFAKYSGFIQHRMIKLAAPTGMADGYARCRAVWQALAAEANVRVVSLKRADLLAMAASFVLARRTGIWQVADPAAPTAVVDATRDPWCAPSIDLCTAERVRIDPQWLERYFATVSWQYVEWDRGLEHHPLLEVWYEDLVADAERSMARVQEFLAVPIEALRPCTRKRQPLPPAEVIENYPGLIRHFRGSRWEHLFH